MARSQLINFFLKTGIGAYRFSTSLVQDVRKQTE
jgi:hypothetical protein